MSTRPSFESELVAWYGHRVDWLAGQPRIANHDKLQILMASEDNSRLSRELEAQVDKHINAHIKSNLCIPIVLANEVVAEINLDSAKNFAFTDHSIEVAHQYALQVGVLLTSLHERQQLESRIREFELIEDLSNSLRSLDEPLKVAERIVQETVRVMNSPHCAMMLMSSKGKSLRWAAYEGDFTKLAHAHPEIPRGKGLTWQALDSRSPIWNNQAHNDERGFAKANPGQAFAQITMPMLNSHGNPVGVLMTARQTGDIYVDKDVRLLQVISNIAVAAIERIEAHKQREIELQHKQFLLTLSHMLEGNDQAHISEALDYVRQILQADAAVITYLPGSKMVAYAIAGELTEPLAKQYSEGWPIEVIRPITKYLMTNQILDGVENPFGDMAQKLGIKAHFGVSLDAGIPYGGVVFYRFKNARPWSKRSVELAKGCARIIGAVINRVEGSNRMVDAYEGALRAIGLALEARDRETAGHTDRVADMAEKIAKELAFSEHQLRDLRWGAYLHDIGKLTISDSILLKPGKLTPEEFDIMKTHAPLGDDLVRNLPFVPDAARQVVRHHHERMDGRGYPDGLNGQHIPLTARIFAICDVFDALCSERPYKAAMSPPQALEELHKMAKGGHLDAELLEVFFKIQRLEPVSIGAAAD